MQLVPLRLGDVGRAIAAARAVDPKWSMVGGLYKLNPVDPQLETAWFQPLSP
jgi:hypothetical protein